MRSVRHFSSIDSYINSFNTDFYIESHDINLLNELDDLVDSSYSKNLYSKLFYFLTGSIQEDGLKSCHK